MFGLSLRSERLPETPDLPWYHTRAAQYPDVVSPGFNRTSAGTVNWSVLKARAMGYSWQNHYSKPCCFSLRHGHAIAFELKLAPWVPRLGYTNEKAQELGVACQKWLSFLLDPAISPWRKVLKDWELVKYGDEPIGLIVKDCNVSRALLHNFFLALRCMWEYPNHVLEFGRLIDRGLPPQVAMFYATFTVPKYGGDRSLAVKDMTNYRYCSHTYVYSPQTNPPLMSRFYDIPDPLIPTALFSTPDNGRNFIQSNFVWHLYRRGRSSGHPLPPVLSEFPSSTVTDKLQWGDRVRYLSVPIEAYYIEIHDAYKKRLQMEREVLSQLDKAA